MSDPSDSWFKQHPWLTLALLLGAVVLVLWLLSRKGGAGQVPTAPASLVSAWTALP